MSVQRPEVYCVKGCTRPDAGDPGSRMHSLCFARACRNGVECFKHLSPQTQKSPVAIGSRHRESQCGAPLPGPRQKRKFSPLVPCRVYCLPPFNCLLPGIYTPSHFRSSSPEAASPPPSLPSRPPPKCPPLPPSSPTTQPRGLPTPMRPRSRTTCTSRKRQISLES